MTLKLLFIGTDDDWAHYGSALETSLADLSVPFELSNAHPHAETDFIIMAGSKVIDDFSGFTRCKALLRLWAGVEDIVANDTITFPMCRMVGGGLDAGMVEWVTGHTLRHHIGMDAHIHGQDGIWRDDVTPPLAAQRPVTILGLGALGTACAQALSSLGFPVTGWARSPKTLKGITCLSGPIGEALDGAEIVITLLPLTPDTTHTLNAQSLSRTAKGAFILNPGRGPLIDDAALLAALDRGHIAHATLDTFAIEPLPKDHPYWAHPNVTVTPHIASATRPNIAADVIVENIERSLNEQPLLHVVDRNSGY